MRDIVMHFGIICFFLSSFTTFGPQRRDFPYPRRILDNLALLGKTSASILAIVALGMTLNFLFFIPVLFYSLSAYFWAIKVGRKGKILVWTRFYEMESWKQSAIDESAPGVGSALCACGANISMTLLSYFFYMNQM